MTLDVTLLTLFPEMFPGPLGYSLAGKALNEGVWNLRAVNIRDFATDKHGTVDDTPYGGGSGMVLRPDILDTAITAAKAEKPNAQFIYMTPRGAPLTQKMVVELHQKSLIILCGRFEAVDERVIEEHRPLEISLGDFVLSGGEVAAMALLDACVRLLPGVISDPLSLAEESFGLSQEYAGLLEYPHYTKPPLWKGRAVPEVLMSGNHAKIKAWRLEQAETITRLRRQDLWDKHCAASNQEKKKK